MHRFFVLVLFAAAAPLIAQPFVTNVELGVGGGRFFGGTLPAGSSALFHDAVILDDTQMKGFWAGASITPTWRAEIAVRRAAGTVVTTGGGLFPHRPILATLDFAAVDALALRTFPRGRFVPYLGAGAGFTSLDINTPDPADQDSNRFCLAVAAGAKFYLGRHLGVVFDVRKRVTYLGAPASGGGNGWRDHRLWFRDPELLAGVFYSTGR